MKKQILFLSFLVLAVLAGVTNSYGQKAVNNTDAQELTGCTDTPLTPIAGRSYDYSAAINPALGTAYWYATTSTTFMTDGNRVAVEQAEGGNFIFEATNYQNATAGATSPSSTSITWNSNGLSTIDADNPLFLVLEYTAPADACSNNMEVYRILPQIAFTLDIVNMDPTGTTSSNYGDLVEQCYDVVRGASWDSGSNSVTMNYGTNTMYFEVIAANFTGSFSPTFQLSGLQTGQTADISWGYTAASATTSIATGASNGTFGPITAETDETDTSAGVSIYVKVVVNNNGYEGITTDPITLAVDGTDASGNTDVKVDCTEEAVFADAATQNLEARPAIDNENPASFLLKN